NRGLKAYQENPEIMIPYIQKRLGVKDAGLARRMYDDDAPFVLEGGRLSAEASKEIIEIGREALRIQEPVAPEKIFDFSLAAEAMKSFFCASRNFQSGLFSCRAAEKTVVDHVGLADRFVYFGQCFGLVDRGLERNVIDETVL